MSLRSPQSFSTNLRDPLQAAIDAEVQEEKALTLARTAERLERALAALAAFESGQAHEPAAERAERPKSRTARDALRALTHTADLSTAPSPYPARKKKGRSGAHDRESLIDEAAEALWFLIIQRELMRLGGEERVCRDYRVPTAVRKRLGILKTSRPEAPQR